MKLKSLTILITLVVIFNVFIVSADVKQNRNIIKSSDENNIIEIRVAIYDNRLNLNNLKESSGGKFLILPLKDYQWRVGNRLYYFSIKVLSTRDILKGDLKVEDYDVLIYSWEQADSFFPYTGFSNLPRNKLRVRRIKEFIEEGGGYFGSCGGAEIATNMINKPTSFMEKSMKKSSLGISCYKMKYYNPGFFSQLSKDFPFGSGEEEYLKKSGAKSFSGICVNCNISKNNPIFDDEIKNTRLIHWVGAPGFIEPDNTDRTTMVLARFPELEFSDNESTKIHHWKYVGGLSGYIREFFTKHNETYWNDFGRISDAWVFAKDWINTGELIKTNISNKAMMTAEIYPNSKQARIVLCSGHPEFKVRWGGHIEDVEDHDENTLYEGFYKWVDFTPEDETIEDELTYNYCVIRRSIAWASKKVLDNDLPPIYGPSQVNDIYPYEQSLNFTIIGNAEIANGIDSLDLYYRYSIDNNSWNNWTFFKKDNDGSDGWQWQFNSPNGTGHYQFCSIREVEFAGYCETEKLPPGPDAIAFINDKNK